MANTGLQNDDKRSEDLKKKQAEAKKPKTLDEELDEALADSFPASDPVSITGRGTPSKSQNRARHRKV